MQVNHTLDQRQANPEAALRPVRAAFGLRKKLKDVRKQTVLDTNACVAYLDTNLTFFR